MEPGTRVNNNKERRKRERGRRHYGHTVHASQKPVSPGREKGLKGPERETQSIRINASVVTYLLSKIKLGGTSVHLS